MNYVFELFLQICGGVVLILVWDIDITGIGILRWLIGWLFCLHFFINIPGIIVSFKRFCGKGIA